MSRPMTCGTIKVIPTTLTLAFDGQGDITTNSPASCIDGQRTGAKPPRATSLQGNWDLCLRCAGRAESLWVHRTRDADLWVDGVDQCRGGKTFILTASGPIRLRLPRRPVQRTGRKSGSRSRTPVAGTRDGNMECGLQDGGVVGSRRIQRTGLLRSITTGTRGSKLTGRRRM